MKNIAVIAGGNSAEFEISIQTANHIFNTIDKEKFNAYLIEINGKDWKVKLNGDTFQIDKNDFSFTHEDQKITFDFAYIAIHGTPGENGILQGYFQLMEIPHSTCDVLSSALSFNKYACNSFLKTQGCKVAKSILLRKNESFCKNEIIAQVGLPCFIKPNADGSSFGISKVKNENEIEQAIQEAFKEGNEVIIEEFIDGLEFTCGLLKTKKEKLIFPVTEVLPKKEFFDFEAKYDPNMAEEITPARISDELTSRIQMESSKIYDALNCKGIVRIDYMIKKSEIYVLEANTVPGMTANSFIPKQVKAMGFELKNILTLVIEDHFD